MVLRKSYVYYRIIYIKEIIWFFGIGIGVIVSVGRVWL
jgi:hypothetical protein